MSNALLRAARAGLRHQQWRRSHHSNALLGSVSSASRNRSLFSQRHRIGFKSQPQPRLNSPTNMVFRTFFWSKDDSGDEKPDSAKKQDDDGDGAVHLEAAEDKTTTALAGQRIPAPDRVLALPVTSRPLFPGLSCHIHVRDPDTIKHLQNLSKEGQPFVGVFLEKQPPTTEFINVLQSGITYVDEPVKLDELYDVGTLAQIIRAAQDKDDGSVLVMLQGHRRIRMKPGQQLEALNATDNAGPPQVGVDHLYLKPYDPKSENVIMYTNEILSTLRQITALNPLFREQVQYLAQSMNILDPARIADLATSLSTSSREDLQDILCTLGAEERLKKMLDIVKQEHQRATMQQEIAAQVEKKMGEDQRKYFLREQLKSIKKELGIEKDDKDAVRQKFLERLSTEGVKPPEEVQLTIDDEMEKFSALEKNSAEYNVTRNYLDWLTSLPWGKHTQDVFDVGTAIQVLDQDHYGMKDVKDRILEFIAVGKLRGQVQGKILCLVGPPGVGKTSIASSIGRCIGREFHRFSVGGVSDVSEIKGHRRTYVGAMPGKLIQTLKATGVSNPVLLIDEIDKLGHGGMHGDPASALLEVLDPSQNSTFMDHYLDVPVDLSKVLFVCTANTTETIPGPLLDRMEVVRLPGYDLPEKTAIAQRYLVPKILQATGLAGESNELVGDSATKATASISTAALNKLIGSYCREAGVRMLERKLETIFRKVALKVVREETPGEQIIEVQENDLTSYVGQPVFDSKRMYDETPVGVVMGLAWSSMGGSTLYIEAASSGPSDRAGLQVTGNMKDVMRESTQIALTCAKIKLAEWASNVDFLDSHSLHLHVPEGATPKDGPSAGCTMVTALLSLALNRPVRNDLAMTGEISLTGRILPVGGIREKVIAARREGVTCLVLPRGNQHDFQDLPDYLRDGLEVHFAEHYDDVFDVAFCEDSDLTF
eukprot:INCI15182.1.p1 GENE.INCI15182.1~~INCI15182.1.p1  ORF type:complete len:974 (+),score=171.34 INCI15182.1:112-2922(+)